MSTVAQARGLYQTGRLREASAILSDLIRRSPADASALQLLGVIQFQSGFQREGLKLVDRATKVGPDNAEAWNALGMMRHLLGDEQAALGAFQTATEKDPAYQEAWKNEGFILQILGRHEESLEALRRAGSSADVVFFIANAYAALGRHFEAIAEYERVLAVDPNHGDAWHNRGNSLLEIGRIEESIESLKEALKRVGPDPLAHTNMAAALARAGREDEALTVIDTVLRWDSTFAKAHEVRSVILRDLESFDLAAEYLESAIELDPSLTDSRASLARVLQGQGKWEGALASLKTATDPGLRFLDALLLPVVFESSQMASDALARMTAKIATLREEGLKLDDPMRQVGITSFQLPYFGVAERPYQEAIVDLYREASPMLRFESAHSSGSGRLRVGVLSALLSKHSVSYVFGGVLGRLDPDKFEVTYLQLGKDDEFTLQFAASAAKHLRLAPSIVAAQNQVAGEKLDMIFYPEVGMDIQTYYMAMSRLAPVQVATWGHPLTTGSPTVDHFVSSAHLEREDGQVDYTENLARLPSLTAYFKRSPQPPPWTRADYGFPENRRVYGCPQSAYKFHPDYDRVLNAIVEQDDRGILVLVEPQHGYLKEVLVKRWERSFPKLPKRVIWLTQMPHDRFLRLMQLCDALLAPVQFGGGRSTYDAFSVGAPVVTYRGPFLKSRITSAAYQEAGIEGLTATTEEEYVAIALKLAKDADWQAEMRCAVAAKTAPLFENSQAVRELEDLLLSLRR